MRRITILARGNADVAGSLHMLREGDAVTWNGINAVLRERHPGVRARVIHQTLARSDALVAATGHTPAALAERALPLGAYSAAAQHGALEATSADMLVLSIQPDVMNRLVRDRVDGHLLYPHDLDAWPQTERSWLRQRYAPVPPLAPEESMAAIAAVMKVIAAPATLILNMSPFVPWEAVHCYAGLGETLGERIRRFNMALADLSRRTGVSIVDVDRLFAGAGAARMKLDAVAFTAEGGRLVAEEVVRILGELGLLAEEAAA